MSVSGVISHALAEFLFASLCDESVSLASCLPTPHTDLPRLNDLIREALKQKQSTEIEHRLRVAMMLSNQMLAAVDANPAPLGAGDGQT